MTASLETPARHRAAAGRPRASEAPTPGEKTLRHYLGVATSAAVLVLVLALAVVTIVLPALVGGRPLTVLTQSMEPGLPPGTLVVVKPTAIQDIRIGDVLTYQLESGRPGVVSHRVIEKTMAADGGVTFVTKGDNNAVADEKPVLEPQIVGTLWYSVPLLGWVNSAVNGDARGVIVPIAAVLLFGYAGWMLVTGIRDARRRQRMSSGGAKLSRP